MEELEVAVLDEAAKITDVAKRNEYLESEIKKAIKKRQDKSEEVKALATEKDRIAKDLVDAQAKLKLITDKDLSDKERLQNNIDELNKQIQTLKPKADASDAYEKERREFLVKDLTPEQKEIALDLGLAKLEKFIVQVQEQKKPGDPGAPKGPQKPFEIESKDPQKWSKINEAFGAGLVK